MGTTAPASVGGTSLWAQLRGQRRLLLFIVVQSPLAMIPGALFALVLNPLAADRLGGESGIGILAAISGITISLTSLVAGGLADRYNPRTVMVAGSSLYAISTGGICVLAAVHVPTFALLTYAAVEAVTVGLFIPPMLRVQAALVPADARGSADIVLNLFRFGSGLVGFQIASAAPDSVIALGLLSAVALVGAVAGWWVSRSAALAPRPPSARGYGVGEVIGSLRDHPALRGAIVAEVLLRLVLPTQLVALFLVDYDVGALVVPLTMAGLAGIAAGRILMLFLGLQGDLRVRLLAGSGAWVALCLAGALLLVDDRGLGLTAVLAGGVFLASACIAVLQGTLAAVIQQRCPDDVRGRISGSLITIKCATEIIALSLTTAIVAQWNTEVILVALAGATVIVVVLLRGYASIRSFTRSQPEGGVRAAG